MLAEEENIPETWPFEMNNYLQGIRILKQVANVDIHALHILYSGHLNNMSREDMLSAIQRNKEELFEIAQAQENDKACLEDLKLTAMLQKLMLDYTDQGNWCFPEDLHEGHDVMCRVLNQLFTKSKLINETVRSNEELEREIHNLRRKMQTNREEIKLMVEQIKQSKKENAQSRPSLQLVDELKRAEIKLRDLHHIFSLLVQASNIEWAEDYELLSMLLKSGENAMLLKSRQWE